MGDAIGVYVVRWFRQWMGKQGLKDWQLCAAVMEMSRGLFDAALGGGLYKKRVARAGQGKRGGYRTLVASKRDGRWFFVYGFEKSKRDDISPTEQSRFKHHGDLLMAMDGDLINQALSRGDLHEVNCSEKTPNPHRGHHPVGGPADAPTWSR